MKTKDFKKISCTFLLALGLAGLARAADVYTYEELRAAVEGASGDQSVNLLADITITNDVPITVTRSVSLRSGGFDTFVIRSSVENATQPLFKVASAGQLAFHGVVLDGENRQRQECAVEVLAGGRLYVESDNTEIRNFRTRDTRANAIFCGGYMEMRPGAVVSNCTSVVCQREFLAFPMDFNVPAAIVIDNNATLALNGGLVTGCTDGGISCRVNGAVRVLGAPVVWGNTQCGQCCDLCIINPLNSLVLDGYFTGKIGVYIYENYPMPSGSAFGLNQRDNKGAQNFHFNGFGGGDVVGDYVGRQGFVGATVNRSLVWGYPVCRVGTDYYATLAEGIKAAQQGDTVELLRNVTLDTKITLTKSLTLASPVQSAYEEGGARTLLRTNDIYGVVTVQDGVTLTLRDIVIADTGYVSSPWLMLENGSTLNMLSGSAASNVAHAVKVNTATLNLAGGQTKDGASVQSGYLATLEGYNAQLNVSGDSKGMVWISRQSKFTLVGDLTGWIKAETTVSPAQGTVFGSAAGDFKGAERIFSAVADDFVGFRDGSNLVWLNTRTSPVCKIGDTKYLLFSNALEEARPGDTITLIGEIPLDRQYEIPCDLTITASEYYRWKFKRTGREGQLYVPAGKTLTLENVELDGANYIASLPLIQVASGGTLVVGEETLIQRCRTFSSLGGAIKCQGTLALEGGVITGNAGSGSMGAVYALGTVRLSGDVRVTGNVGTGLSMSSADQLRIVGPFTGAVELGYPVSPAEGSAFGVVGDYAPTVNEVRRIVYRGEIETDFIAASDGEKLYWTANIVSAESGDDLGDAIAAGGAGTGPRVIEIGADFSAGTVVIPAGEDVIIDLRGNTLTADIVARGNLTIVDSSEGQTGRVVGSLAEEGAGSLTLDAGAYSAALDPDWIADGCVVLGNYDGSHQVLAETTPSEVHGVTLDTRRGVRVVDDPELDVLPLTYSSGHWVFGESGDEADTSWVAVADALGPDPYTNALWHAGMVDNVAARGDKSYDYPSGNSNIVCSAQWLQVYDGPWEHEEVWLQDRVGLVEAVHSNRYGVIRAWYKYPEPTYQLVVKYQYEDGTSAMNDYTDTLQEGDSYAVDSPAILGYRADIVVVEGTMPGEDVTVVVTYKPLPEGDRLVTVPDPVEKVYDGIPTNIAVTVTTTSDDDPLDPEDYSITYFYDPSNPQAPGDIPPDAEWDPDLDFTDATPGTNTVWYIVEVPGYHPVTNKSTVVITKREVTIEFDTYVQTNDVRKVGDFAWTHVGGELIGGDEIVVPSSVCTNYPASGTNTVGSITSETAMVVDAEGNESGNYVVRVVPGDYYWLDNEIFVEAKGVTVVYDGQEYGITVKWLSTRRPPTVEELHAQFGNTGIHTYISEPEVSGPYFRYSIDGGNTYSFIPPPTYTDVGTNTVYVEVYFEYVYFYGLSEKKAYYSVRKPFGKRASADVVILPRPVYVTADSAEKFYDGEPLVDGGYTVAPPTSVTGFVEGEGATFRMTDDSTITNPGSTANRIDPSDVQLYPNTNRDNYEFHYFDGTLTVKDRLLSAPTGVEKIYNGDPVGIGVTVAKSTAPDTPLEPGGYTIRYSLDPDDPTSWTNELSFVNVGVSNKVWYVVEMPGYDPVTNFEYVTIWPREIVVRADNKKKLLGENDPTLTWTIADGTNALGETVGILSDEFDLVNAAVSNDLMHVIFREGAGTPDGELATPPGGPGYPIVVGGSEYLGNYHVTYVPGELAVSTFFISNIHGLLKIESPFANTIIPAPWKGYTRDGSPTNDIRVDRLVKPRNLTDGDMILQYSNGGVYKAWTLERTNGVEGVWTPMGTEAQMPVVDGSTNVVASLHVPPTGGETQKRGYGMWLWRQRPVDEDDRPIPFYLYGQWMTGVETVTIGGVDENDVAIRYAGAQYSVVHDTMLADPDCTRASVINLHTWAGFDTADTIILNTDLKQSLYCFRRERPKRSGGGYYDGWWMWGEGGYTTNNISTLPGVGFWYERRAPGDMELTWDGPARYTGEGRDLDVWIVDHADAGDGKTHLAFKFVGDYAPATITPDYIRELFDSDSIRYLHASGETQAEGKAEMDRLSENPKAYAQVVLALRNGTGVNTPEELAKGWIWVTVDVPDGTAEKSSQDGTGDTNGAGDLWRIVVGRGVW